MQYVAGFSAFAIVFALFVIVTLMAGIRQVPQGYAYTVERFGKYTRTLQAGLGVIVPYIDRIGHKVNMMEQVLDVPRQEVITKDNASISVDGVAFYQVLDAPRASYQITNLTQALLNLIMTNIRTVMGSMDLDQLLSHRDEINVKLLRVVDQAGEIWGIKCNRIEIKDIVPPKDLVDSMARQMKAEREKRANVLEAEGLRQAEILRAEGRKQALVLDAEGRKEATFRDAEARERQAQAEATATGMVSEAIAKGDMAALNYFIAEKYVHAIEAVARSPNQKVFIMPIEMSSLVGTLAGIAEIAKSAGGSGGDIIKPPSALQPKRGGASPAAPNEPAPWK